MPDFSFLLDRAGFQLAESLLDTLPTDTYLRVLVAGLVNTLTVLAVALPLATVLGVCLGLLRLTRHPVLYRALAVGVEPVRNTPVLLQLFVWYSLLLNLPEVRDAWQPLPGVFISNRGLAVPLVMGAGHYLLVFFSSLLLAAFLWRCFVRVPQGDGPAARRWWRGARLPLGLLGALVVALQIGALPALVVELPELAGFGLAGGWTLSPEFTALVAGLTLFHAVYISDVVRGAVLAVPSGQVDAARALGLGPAGVARFAVYPFAVRAAVPPYANQCLMLLKNSTLAIAIGYQELMAIVNTTITQTGRALEGMAIAASSYVLASLLLAALLARYNQRVTRHGIDGAGVARLGQRLHMPPLTRDAVWGAPWRAGLSVLLVALGCWAVVGGLRWGVWDALWRGNAQACENAAGACWAVVTANWQLLMFGTMSPGQRPTAGWAVLLVVAGVLFALAWRLPPRWRIAGSTALWLGAALALAGQAWGLPAVAPVQWGGVLVTVVMSVASVSLALPLAVLLALMRRSARRWVHGIAVAVIEVVRAIPLVTQLLLVSFLIPLWWGGDWSASKFQLALAALVLHTACLLAEVLRGALQAVPASQTLSAKALGMRPFTVLRSVLLPQASRIGAPAALGVFVGAVKDTSLVAVIGVFDILSAAKAVVADTGWRPHYVEVYAAVGLFYFVVCLGLSRTAERLRRGGAGRS